MPRAKPAEPGVAGPQRAKNFFFEGNARPSLVLKCINVM